MKYSWSIFTKTALALTLASGVAPANAETIEADIHLDALDADGHLSILEASVNEKIASQQAPVEAQAVKIEQKAEKAKGELVTATEKVVEKAKSKYSSAKEAYIKEAHDSKASTAIAAAPKAKADAHGKDSAYSKDSTDKGFLTKGTTEIEFTFAILVIIIGLIASERFQRAKDEHMETVPENSNNEFQALEDS